jgi:hypothetical protein
MAADCFTQPATTVRSIVTAAGDERQAVVFWFRIEVTRSPSAATGSPDPSHSRKSDRSRRENAP